MSNLLSQDEVDALFADGEISLNKTEVEAAVAKSAASIYDFKHPNRLTKDQLRNLRVIHDSFARSVSTYLASVLKTNVEARLACIDQVTLKDFTMAMSEIDFLWLFKIQESEGQGLVEISPALVFMIVDKLFGGDGQPPKNIRPATDIEQNVVRRVLERILKLWDESWPKIYDVNSVLLTFEDNPELVQIAPMSDSVMAVFLEITVYNQTFSFNICLPFFIIEPMVRGMANQALPNAAPSKGSERHKTLVKAVIKKTLVPISVELGRTAVTIKEFLDLEIGDVLMLNQDTNNDISVTIGNEIRFAARPGIVGRKKAIQITNFVN